MDVFPFSETDWQRVQDTSRAVLDATLANDDVLRASHFEELMAVLNELREQYGDHPILRETEADFLDNPSLQLDAYQLAIELAKRNNLPTLSIRMSLARVLLEDFGNARQATEELLACESELTDSDDESQRQEWSELRDQCQQHVADS